MTDKHKSAMEELAEIAKEMEDSLSKNPISNTALQLLEIEKKALYGNFKNKNKEQEIVINEGLGKYREYKNVNS